MRFHEIITEAITFARYSDDVENIIISAVATAVTKLDRTPVTDNYRNTVAKSDTIDPLKIWIQPYLYKDIRDTVKKQLARFASEIILNKKTGIAIAWKEMEENGQQLGYKISLNTEMLDWLTSSTWEAIDNYVFNHYIEHPYDDMWILVRNKEKIENALRSNTEFGHALKKINGTFLHELVHVRQDLPQFIKGIENTEYRSYLDKTKNEFRNTVGKTLDGDEQERHLLLYRASPQEIESRSHELAIHILRKHFKNRSDVASYTPQQLRAIIDEVPVWAKKAFPNPTTPQEVAVYKRYISKIIQQIRDYVEGQ